MKLIFPPILAPLLIIALLALAGAEISRWQLTAFFDRNTQKVPELGLSNQPVNKTAGIINKKRPAMKSNANLIVKRQLFGSPPQPKSIAKENKKLPVLTAADLKVVLMGTIGVDTDDGKAIIMDKRNNKQQLYKKGDKVQGAEVKQVLRGKVILSIGGQDKILQMNESIKYTPKLPPPKKIQPSTKQANKTQSTSSS